MTNARSQPHHDSAGRRAGRPAQGSRSRDFQAAVARLERAVEELVATAREQFSDRAASFLDETTARLERELQRRRSGGPSAAGDRRGESRDSRRAAASEPLPRRLYRDPARQRIVGVCAGIARYYGVEPWVVRCIAVTGLLFFPSIVFPAYWILYFVMDKPPASAGDGGAGRGRGCPGNRRRRHDPGSLSPELGARRSPRHSLREVQADLAEVELRLRRMETHVTSGQYELQRELNRIDGDGAPRRA